MPNATSLIYQTFQHFTSAWLEKCPIYWWSLQRGIHYVRSLAVEKICTTVLHPDSGYSCLGFEFPSWTPNIDLTNLSSDIPCTFWFVSLCRSIDTAAGQWTQAHIEALEELYERQRRTEGARYYQVSSSCTITFTSTSTSTFVEVFEDLESQAFLTRSSLEDWSEILRVIGFCSVDFWSLCQLKVTLSLKQK